MRLFFDEDVGRSVPDALGCVGINVDYVGRKKSGKGVRIGAKDPQWLERAGRLGKLVFSCNKGILKNEAERQLIITHKVGIVFLTTGQEKPIEVLRLILNKLDWLEWIDTNLPRPFAFTITITGRTTLLIGEKAVASKYRRKGKRRRSRA